MRIFGSAHPVVNTRDDSWIHISILRNSGTTWETGILRKTVTIIIKHFELGAVEILVLMLMGPHS